MDGHDSEDPKQSTAKMTVFDLLQQMQSNFRTFLDSIVSKIDEIRNRVDELEKSIYWQRFQNEGNRIVACYPPVDDRRSLQMVHESNLRPLD
uniref:Rx N-terminal domain-containing protein n=1 Tax=Salix viminalis TaxID=40686 RepID=A0A6N2MI77_SALVM